MNWYHIQTHQDWRHAMAVAVQLADDSDAKVLSQIRQDMKKKQEKYCPDCGQPKSVGSARCWMCYRAKRIGLVVRKAVA